MTWRSRSWGCPATSPDGWPGPPARMGNSLAVANQDVGSDIEFLVSLDHRGHFTKAQEARDIGKSRLGDDARLLDHLPGSGTKDHDRGEQPLAAPFVRDIGPGDRAIGRQLAVVCTLAANRSCRSRLGCGQIPGVQILDPRHWRHPPRITARRPGSSHCSAAEHPRQQVIAHRNPQ